MKRGPGRLWAGCFALSAFTVAIIMGLWADNTAMLVLVRALIAMVLCYPLGLGAGWLCERVVESHREAVADAESDGTAHASDDPEIETSGVTTAETPEEEAVPA